MMLAVLRRQARMLFGSTFTASFAVENYTSQAAARWPTMVLSETRPLRGGTMALLGCPREHMVARETCSVLSGDSA
jgi:hypothetical protein